MISKKLCKGSPWVNLFFAASLLCGESVFAQTGEDLVKQMHKKYYGRWYHTLTFVQTTDIYRNDSLKEPAPGMKLLIFHTNSVLILVISRTVTQLFISKILRTVSKTTS